MQGLQGIKGDNGMQGLQGIKGDNGMQGLQGETGETGQTGAKGDIGLQGERGDSGDGVDIFAEKQIRNLQAKIKNMSSTGLIIGALFAVFALANTAYVTIVVNNGRQKRELDNPKKLTDQKEEKTKKTEKRKKIKFHEYL